MVLSTEWSQVEVIDLVNDGSGLGFGIVGGRSTGVVIKSILPGGIADKDNRLQSGDHILQIGEVNLKGLSADQVATVLRQAGLQVRMVVARPIEPSSADFHTYNTASQIVVPTKILTDQEELDRQLLQNGYTTSTYSKYAQSIETNENITSNCIEVKSFSNYDIDKVQSNGICPTNVTIINGCDNVPNIGNKSSPIIIENKEDINAVEVNCNNSESSDSSEAETEKFSVTLNRDDQGLGITVAGYVWEHEDLSGIFVKSLNKISEAYKCGKINVYDRIVEVNGRSLENCSNHEAVQTLKKSGDVLNITFERYLRGRKFEHLQEAFGEKNALFNERKQGSASLDSVGSLNCIQTDPVPNIVSTESLLSIDSEIYDQNPENKEIFIEEDFEANLEDDLESAIKEKWQNIIGKSEADIVVCNLTKLKGLGISLEGTVDVERGIELRPHHYIRSILPEGPVGQSKKLCPGDELLEVNGQKLLGIKHVEVVQILKELPSTVRLVCYRENKNRVIDTSQDREAFEARNILGGSLKNLLPEPEVKEQKLIKALSDTSLNTSSTVTADESVLQKAKSRSLEGTNVAMWSEDIEYVELIKAEKGLGFSILDYQDPLDPKQSVIVVRSVIPNGPAEQNGKITPGDKLISVNGKVIKNATLDEAAQVLKATLPGVVTLGISKPLPSVVV